MNVNCACGGKYHRTDIVKVPGENSWKDTNNFIASWRCNGCGKTRTQKKRQPAHLPGEIRNDTVKVIRAPWDAALDYYIPRKRAIQLYEEGKLSWDLTNKEYTTYIDWQNRRAGDRIE